MDMKTDSGIAGHDTITNTCDSEKDSNALGKKKEASPIEKSKNITGLCWS